MSISDWVQCQRGKGAVNLHVKLDHDGYLPQLAVITSGKTAEIYVARSQHFEPVAMLVFDSGYQDFIWW